MTTFSVFPTCDPLADFAYRDTLPETLVPRDKWDQYGMWGPPAATYPPVAACDWMTPRQRVDWQRQRIVEAARKYIGLPYAHHHIPAWDDRGKVIDGEVINDSGHGLDCSNFTSWVYNYALGIKFTSDVHKQSDTVGRQLNKREQMIVGDLLFFERQDRSEISHVGLYTGNGQMIDSRGSRDGVTEHPISGWYASHLSRIRRVLE